MSRKGAPQFASLLEDCVLWAPLSSSNVTNTAKTVTANGNATQSTAVLDPWGLARPVGYFDGNGDYLSIANSADFNFSNSDFCIEACIYLTTNNVLHTVYGQVNATNYCPVCLVITDTNKLYTQGSTSGSGWTYQITGNTTILTNQWYHVAVVRYNGYIRLYLNGVEDATAYNIGTNALFSATTVETIGFYRTGQTGYLNGYLSELQVSKGTARYTTAFTPSTTRFKPDSYTKLLLHMYGSGATFVDDPFVDYDCYPVIPSGVTVTNNGTFTKTSLGNNKSVLNFDGSTNYISLTDNAAWNFGSGDFTIGVWIKIISSPVVAATIINKRANGSVISPFQLSVTSTREISFSGSTNGTDWNANVNIGTLELNTWYYIAVAKSSTTITSYVNGAFAYSESITSSLISNTSPVYIGHVNNFTYDLHGNLKDLMIFKGRALTQPEIKLLMNRTHPITGAGLMPANGDYWRTS